MLMKGETPSACVARLVADSGKTSGDIRVDCPLCQGHGSQNKTLGINIDNGVYHCFRCGNRGNYLKKNRSKKLPKAEYIFNQASKSKTHPYVTKKQIHPRYIKVDKYDNWVVPFQNCEGKFQTVQLIKPDGKKLFLSRAKNSGVGVKGAAYKIYGAEDLVYVCEGPATGYSIHEATGATVYCVGGKENFRYVLPWVKTKHKTVVVAADNDSNGNGLKAANKAAFENGLKITIPPKKGKKGVDFNDYVIDIGYQMARVILEDPKEPTPSKEPEQLIDPETQAQIYLENEAKLRALNKIHAAIMVGGKFYVLNKFIDPTTKRPDISFSSASDFKNRYANKHLVSPENSTGKGKPIAEAWLKYEDRREYDGIIFDPNDTSQNYYNLWQGLSYAPKKGNWNLFEAHILKVICSGNLSLFNWVICWMARIVQDPGGKRPGTAIVLRGKQGTGKGVFVNTFGKIFGKHFLQIAQPSQVVGRFNHHLKDGLLVFVDEGFWAGDKQAEGVIKNMITEPFINIEQKGKDIIRVKNHVNLIIASNNSWVIPAGLEERRFFVLDVSDEYQQDHKYFAAIIEQMENGGLEAMLHELMEMDISDVNLREIPQTAGLFEQKLYSMDTVQKYWFERLKEGNLRPYQPGKIDKYGDTGPISWGHEIMIYDQYQDYREFAENLNIRHVLSLEQFGIALKKLCPGFKKTRFRVPGGGGLTYVRKFPSLEKCRAEFDRLLKMEIPWNEGGKE